jgi:hypothetical protein
MVEREVRCAFVDEGRVLHRGAEVGGNLHEHGTPGFVTGQNPSVRDQIVERLHGPVAQSLHALRDRLAVLHVGADLALDGVRDVAVELAALRFGGAEDLVSHERAVFEVNVKLLGLLAAAADHAGRRRAVRLREV